MYLQPERPERPMHHNRSLMAWAGMTAVPQAWDIIFNSSYTDIHHINATCTLCSVIKVVMKLEIVRGWVDLIKSHHQHTHMTLLSSKLQGRFTTISYFLA